MQQPSDPPPPRPTEVAFTVRQVDGSSACLRIEFDLFVRRLAGLSESLLVAVAARRGRQPQAIPPTVLQEVIEGMLSVAATRCVRGGGGGESAAAPGIVPEGEADGTRFPSPWSDW
jgi:hypothetical protein